MDNEYDAWRIHDKIIPSWMTPTDIAEDTYILLQEKPEIPVPTEPASAEAMLVGNTPKDVANTIVKS